MASAIVADPSPKEPSSGGLLSKFARSPSRKHKPRPSSDSIEAIAPVPPSKPTKLRPRPGLQRTATESAAQVTLSDIQETPKKDDVKNLPPVDRKMDISGFALADATRAPTFKLGPKKKDVAPEIPAISTTPIIQNGIIATTASGQSNPGATYQHIYDMSSKRIATLDYMRKAHEGRIYWFNTVHFSRADVTRLPSYTPARLARRATNYLLLGMSIPAVLDVYPIHPNNNAATNVAIAQEYLKSLNLLFAEFESFQQIHPMDGSSASSLTRARLPQMFKRSTATRPRKSSGPVTEIGMPLQQTTSAPSVPDKPPGTSHSHTASVDVHDSASSSSTTLAPPPPAQPVQTSFPTLSSFPPPAPVDAPNSTLLPNEGPYTHLITPPLPFSPDFFTVFSTLCDVLIDVYQKLLQLLSSTNVCTPALGEAFTKVDARIRKVMVGGIVREFEVSCRDNAKKELMGVQKVVLGGLMGQ